MKALINWLVSWLCALIIQLSLDYFLPPDMSRMWVIGISGTAAIFWLRLISDPLDWWSRRNHATK